MVKTNPRNYELARDLIGSGRWRVDPGAGLIYGSRGRAFSTRNRDGYVITGFEAEGRMRQVMIHRLVWESVNGPIPDGLEINHRNGVKDDNRILNIEMVTGAENVRHAQRTGLSAVSRGVGRLQPEQVLDLYRRSWAGESATSLMEAYGVNRNYFHNVRTGNCWSWLTGHANRRPPAYRPLKPTHLCAR